MKKKGDAPCISVPDRRVRFLNRGSLYVFDVASVRRARLE